MTTPEENARSTRRLTRWTALFGAAAVLAALPLWSGGRAEEADDDSGCPAMAHMDEGGDGAQSMALPPGHPPVGDGASRLPAGHPPVGEGEALPPGHPPVSAAPALPPGHPPVAGLRALPPGHPPVSRLPAGHPPVGAGDRLEPAAFPPGFLMTL